MIPLRTRIREAWAVLRGRKMASPPPPDQETLRLKAEWPDYPGPKVENVPLDSIPSWRRY